MNNKKKNHLSQNEKLSERYRIWRKYHRNASLIASLGVLGASGVGIGVGYSIWHSKPSNDSTKNYESYFFTNNEFRSVYGNNYEFDNFSDGHIWGGTGLSIFFSTSYEDSQFFTSKFRSGQYILAFDTKDQEVLENLLSFYHQSFGIIDSKTVQFDFNFTGSGSDFHDASKTCKFKISIFDTINNKVIYTCPQVFIYHEYDQE